MQSSVQAVGLELDEATRQFIRRRLEFTLNRFGSLVRAVTVNLGQRVSRTGEAGYTLRIVVKLSNAELPVEAEVQGSDLESAIAFALERVGRTIERQVMIRWP